MENFNTEELKTIIGHIMLDLRGSWANQYLDRMHLVSNALIKLLAADPKKWQYKSDLEIVEDEISDPCDGRIFSNCFLYGYSSEEGKTRKVWKFLKENLSYPEYNNFKINNA